MCSSDLLQADHGEFAVAKPERGIPRGGEAEQGVGPVMDAENAFQIEIAHFRWILPLDPG